MFNRIVIALQKESEAPGLARVARKLASGEDAAVLALHLRRVAPEDEDAEPYDEADVIAAAAVAEAREQGLHAESEVLGIDRDRPFGRAIADVALGWRADAIVMGSRGQSDLGAALHGSVSHDVIRLATCPVVIAGDGLQDLDSILLVVDGSPAAHASEELVTQVARECGAGVAVVHVPRPLVISGFAAAGWYAPAPEEDEIARAVVERLVQAGVKARPVDLPLYPPIASAIARAAESVDADLVVIGSRGLTELGALLRGSVSHELLHETTRPVLVTRAKRA